MLREYYLITSVLSRSPLQRKLLRSFLDPFILLYGKALLRFSFLVGQLCVSILHFGLFALSVFFGYELIAFCVHSKRTRRKWEWKMDYDAQLEERLNGDDNESLQEKELRAEITKEWMTSESIQHEIGRDGSESRV